jgi:hypothetical protein
MVIAVVWALCSAPAFAQIGQGRLGGLVTDAQGAVLPGVSVTVTSPSLQGNRTSVTEADGKYLFPSLPSGTYKIVFDLQASGNSSARTCRSSRAKRSLQMSSCSSAASPKT